MMLKRIISLGTLLVFFVQTVCFSAPVTGETAAWGRPDLAVPEGDSIRPLEIPSELGTVENLSAGSRGKGLLVHIQNAHGSYEAQKNIRKIIGYLTDRYGFKVLFLEGANEKLDPRLFRFFKDNEINLRVADILMKHGEFTGAEMFLLDRNFSEASFPVEAYGIEDPDAYLADLERFRKVISDRGKSEAFIVSVSRSVDLLESRFFSNELRDFVKEWRRYREGRTDLLSFLGVLEKSGGEALGMNLPDAESQGARGSILRVLRLRQIEKRLDREKAAEEKEKLAKFLEGKVDGELLREFRGLDLFASASGNFHPRFLFERIYEQARPRGLDFRHYPHFTLCAEYLILQSEIESRLLFQEIGDLTDALFDRLAVREEEKELVRLIQDLVLLEKLLRLELSREEYQTVLNGKDRVNPSVIVRRAESLAPKDLGISADASVNALFDEALDFYRLAEEREAHFIRRIEDVMNERNQVRSIIVTGGFHSEGIGERLKERGYSYACVSPRMASPGNSQEIYLRAMLGETRILASSEIEVPLRLNPKRIGRSAAEDERPLKAAVELALTESGVGDTDTLLRRIADGEREISLPHFAEGQSRKLIPSKAPDGEIPSARPEMKPFQPFAMAASLGRDMDFWEKLRFSSPGLSLLSLIETASSLKLNLSFGRRELLLAALLGIVGCTTSGAVENVGIITPSQAASQPDYSGRYVSVFSEQVPASDLSGQVQIQQRFVRQVLERETAFYQGGLAFNGASGLTYDGQVLDSQTLRPLGTPRGWSAPSKESLHISLLALSIEGADNARLIVPAEAAKKILERKIASYERFNQAYPGFGGFLPWFEVSDAGLRPTTDWADRVPALDNGQLAWAIYLAYHALEKAGEHDLAGRYKNYFDLLRTNVRQVFYEGDGRIRGEAQIGNAGAKPTPGNYSLRDGGYFLADPYEGELMTFFMSLFGGLSDAEVQALWETRQGELQPVEFETPEGPLTVARGHYFSAHEQWKYLVLPYVDVDIARTIFINGEKARTIYSAQNNIPGLMAAAHLPNPVNPREPGYAANFGITELAKFPASQNVVTPYAAFPVILAAQAEGNAGPGLLWLDQMLGLPKMQGPLGMSESFRVDSMDGKTVVGTTTPIVTWDVKGTTALALLGGTHRQIADALRADGKYDRFTAMVQTEYQNAFPVVHTSNGSFGQFRPPLSSAEAQKAEREAERDGFRSTLTQIGKVPIVPDEPETSVHFFSAIHAMENGERPFPDGTLLHTIGDDGICRVEEDPWHFLGRSVPEGMRIPGRGQGYHYAYLRVRAPAGDTEFRVEMKGFFSGKQVVSIRGKEWQWVEFKFTSDQDMYYFAISDVMRRFEVSDFWVSKGHFPGAQVQAYSAQSLGGQRFWMTPGGERKLDLPGFAGGIRTTFNGFRTYRNGSQGQGEFVFTAPGMIVLPLSEWRQIREDAEAVNRQIRTAGSRSHYRVVAGRGGKIVFYNPATRQAGLFDVTYLDSTQNRARIRLTASSLGESILDEAVRMIPLNEETLAGELAKIGSAEDIVNLSRRIPRTVPEDVRPVLRELLAGDFKLKVLEILRGKIRDGKVLNAVLRDEAYAGYLNDETEPDSLAWVREDGRIIVLNKYYEYLAGLRLKDSERAERLFSALLIRLAVTDVLKQGLRARHITMTPAIQQAVRKFARLYEAQIAGPSALGGADTALNDFSRGFINLNRLDRQVAFRRSEKFMRSQPSRAERVMDSFDRKLKALMDGYYRNREFYRRAGRETRNIADMRIKFWSAFEGMRGAFTAENFNGLSVRAVQAIDEIQDPDILGWKIQQYAERYEDILRRMAECAGKDVKAERLERLNQEARDILSRLILMEMHPLRIEKFLSDPSIRPGSDAYQLVFARLWQLRYHMEAFARELMWQRVRTSGRKELMRYVSESGNEDSIGDYLMSPVFFRGSAEDGTRVPEFLTAATGEVRGGGQYVRDTVQKLLAGGAIEYEMAGYRTREIHYRATLNSLFSPYWQTAGFREFLLKRLKDEGVRIRKPVDQVVPGDILDALTSGKIYEEQLAGVILADAEAYLLSTAPDEETRETIQRNFDEKSGPDIAEVGEERVTYRYKHIFDLLRAFNGTLAGYFRSNETAYDMLGYLDDIQDRFKALKRGGLRNVPGVADARENAWRAIRRDLAIVFQWAGSGDKPSRTMVAEELLGAQLAVEFKDAERFERAVSRARFLIENYIDENVRISKYTALKAMHVRDRIRRPVQILLKGARIYDAKREIERMRDRFFPPRFDAPGYSRARARIRLVLERLEKMDGRTVLFTRDTARNNRIRERYVKLLVDLEMFLFDVIYKHVPDEEFAEIEPALRAEIEGRILSGKTMDQVTFSRETLRELQTRVAQTGASLGGQAAALRELTELLALHPNVGDLYEEAHIGDYLSLTVKGYHGKKGNFVVEVIVDVSAPGVVLDKVKIALIDNQTGEPAAVSKLSHVENTGYFTYFGKLDAGKTYRLELAGEEKASGLAAVGSSLGEGLDDLEAWHGYFASLAKEAGKRAKKAEKKDEDYQPFKLILNVREADGNIAAEEVIFPSKNVYYENRENVIRYLALLIHVRGVLTGATEVAIDVSPAGAIRERIRHAIVRDVAEVLKREFGETGSFSSFGKWIKFNAIAKRLEADERVSEVSEKAPVDYSKGDAIGIDIGGTNIKLAVVRNGQELFTETVPVAGIVEPLGEYLEKRMDELAARFGVDAAKALYVTVPGPVTPAGAIVKITNLEESRPGTTDSLRAFQERRKNIRYQNDANTAAFYQMVMQGLSGNVILNTLGTGLGLGIIIDGKLIAGPQEAHVRAFFGENAVHHEGFNMNGDLESYANAEFVVRRTKELLAEQGIPVPDELTPRVVGEWLTMDKKDPLAKIARKVYREFGANLAILYREIARVTGIHEWTVVFVGGIAKGESGNEIVKGVQKAAGKKLKLNIKVGEEAEYTGALGAAYQGVQAGQIEGASLGEGIQRVLVIDDEAPVSVVLSQLLKKWNREVQVVTAENGEEGMQLYRAAQAGEGGQKPFDLVLTDINMPRKTGFEVIREINPPERKETVPVILMTGLSSNLSEAQKLMGSGQLRFAVSKPFDFGKDIRPLIETIQRELIEADPAMSLGTRKNIEATIAWVEERLGGELWGKEALRKGFFDWSEAFKAGPIFVPRAVVPNEARMGMTPIGVEFLRRMGVENNIFVEAGSGINRYTGEIYFSDEEYRRAGAIVLEHDDFVEAAKEASQYVGSQKVVVSIKEPQESEYEILENALLFTYVHLAEPHAKALTEKLQAITNAVVAYETVMFKEKSMWKTPILAPASEGAGWVTAIRYANYVKHVKGRKVVDGRAVLDEATEALIRKNVQSYPDIPEDLKDALQGRKAMVFGGGIAGANCAMAMAKMGAYVYITEVNEDRIRELTEWFTSEGLMSRVEILKRPDPRHEKNLPLWIIEKLKECHAVVGAILVPGATAPVELTEDIYQQLMKAGRHFFLEDRLPSFMNLSPLEFLGDIAVDQGGNIAGTRPRKYEDGWVTAREVYLFGFKIVNETVVRILEAVQDVLNALFGMEAFNWVRRVNWFTVTNMPSALPKQISMGLERAKLVYLLALLMGPEKAVEIFPELKPGFNILNGKITFDQVAKKHGLEYTPFEEAAASSMGSKEIASEILPAKEAESAGASQPETVTLDDLLYDMEGVGKVLTLLNYLGNGRTEFFYVRENGSAYYSQSVAVWEGGKARPVTEIPLKRLDPRVPEDQRLLENAGLKQILGSLTKDPHQSLLVVTVPRSVQLAVFPDGKAFPVHYADSTDHPAMVDITESFDARKYEALKDLDDVQALLTQASAGSLGTENRDIQSAVPGEFELIQPDEEVKAYVRERGRAAWWAVGGVMRSHEEGGITEGIAFLPAAGPAVLRWFLSQFGLTAKDANAEVSEPIRRFNEGKLTPIILKDLGVRGSHEKFPFVVSIDGLFGKETGGTDERVDGLARRIGDCLNEEDLLIAVWDATGSFGKKPKLVDRLYKAAAALRFKMRDVPRELFGVRIGQLTRAYDAPVISVSNLNETTDLEVNLRNGTRVKLDVKDLLRNGVDLVEAVGLIRQLADEDPEQLALNFKRAGFQQPAAGSDYWQVTAGNLIALIQTAYEASRRLAVAA